MGTRNRVGQSDKDAFPDGRWPRRVRGARSRGRVDLSRPHLSPATSGELEIYLFASPTTAARIMTAQVWPVVSVELPRARIGVLLPLLRSTEPTDLLPVPSLRSRASRRPRPGMQPIGQVPGGGLGGGLPGFWDRQSRFGVGHALRGRGCANRCVLHGARPPAAVMLSLVVWPPRRYDHLMASSPHSSSVHIACPNLWKHTARDNEPGH